MAGVPVVSLESKGFCEDTSGVRVFMSLPVAVVVYVEFRRFLSAVDRSPVVSSVYSPRVLSRPGALRHAFR